MTCIKELVNGNPEDVPNPVILDPTCCANCALVAKAKPASFTDIAFETGRIAKHAEVMKNLDDYLELTRFSEEAEGAEPNPEWENGYQAAMSIARGDCECDWCADRNCPCFGVKCPVCKVRES